eukprot:1142096-Pelagomonas_calceolata.AAC.2
MVYNITGMWHSCPLLRWSSARCRACCVTQGVSRRMKERKKWFWHGIWIITWCTSYVNVNQACSPRAFAKSFCDHSSSNIMAFSLHIRDDMILATCEYVEGTF